MAGESLTVADYRRKVSACTGDLCGHDGAILDDDVVITVSDDGQQYMVGTDASAVDEWIDLY